MATYRMRPRFQIPVRATVEEALKRFEARLKEPDCPVSGQLRQRHVLLRIPPERRHLWSPFLDLEFVADESGERCVGHGLIGPSPEVWTFFIAGYAVLGFLAFVGLVLGYAQWTIGQSTWGFTMLPVLAVAAIGWYSLSQIGQRLADPQIRELRLFLAEVVLPIGAHNDSLQPSGDLSWDELAEANAPESGEEGGESGSLRSAEAC